MAQVVYQYGGPPIAFGAIDADEVGTFPVYEGVDSANLGAHEGQAMLLVATPFVSTATVETPGPMPFGTIDDILANNFHVPGALTTIYPAATHGDSSSPSDTPANTYIPSKFTGEIQYQQALFGGANPLAKGSASFGELVLLDPDGELDTLLDYGWDGISMELRRGAPGAAFSTYTTIAYFTSASGLVGDLFEKRIRLRNLGWILEAAELHGNRYLGTGGIEGSSTLTGRLKPYTAGYVFNITPVLINTTSLVFQASYTSIRSVQEVRDGGAALSFAANYSTYDALVAATVSAGQYATCLAYGLIRVGSAPVYGITMDLCGDNDTYNSVTGPTTRGAIVRRIATGIGSLRLLDSTQVDYTSFVQFESKQPAEVGFYWDGSNAITKAAALDEIMAGCVGFWFVRPNGQLSIGQVEDPASYSPTLTLGYPSTSNDGESRLGEPVILDVIPPRRATYIGYKRNYTQQGQSDLAGTVTQANALIYSQETRYSGQGSLWLANSYQTAPAVFVQGNYRNESDASAEAQRQQTLFSVMRRRYSIPIVMDPLADVVAQKAQINYFNRMGWGSSKNLLVCGIQTAGSSVELHFWG